MNGRSSAASRIWKSHLRVFVQCRVISARWPQLQQLLDQQGLVAPLTPARLCARCAPTFPLVLNKFFQIGGKPVPAVGWALGMERILELLKEQDRLPSQPSPDAYAVVPDAMQLPRVMPVLRALREHGVSVLMHAGGAEGSASMKSQFKKADASGARFALIFGADELEQDAVAVKHLRAPQQEAVMGNAPVQTLRPLAEVADWAHALKAS